MWRTTDEQRRDSAQWRRTWRSLPRAEQRGIVDALSKGTAVKDRQLAPLAMELAERRLGRMNTPGLEDRPGSMMLLARLYALAALVMLPSAITRSGPAWDPFFLAPLIWCFAAITALAIAKYQQRRLERAYAANARLLGTASGDDPYAG